MSQTPDSSRSGCSTDAERDAVETQRRPSALVIHEVLRAEGEEELRHPLSILAFSGLAAGLSMGFSMMATGLLQAGLPDAPWRHLVTSIGYGVGFSIVVLGRQKLYTETTLAPVLPMLAAPSRHKLGRLLRLWAVVLAANLAGAYLFATAAYHLPVFTPEAKAAFAEIGVRAAEGGFGVIALKGVFAGWLIALMAWLLPAVVESRIWLIIGMTWLVALGHLSHVVTGSVEIMYAATAGEVAWSTYWGGFMLPALLGNTIGGVVLAAMLNHGQVRASMR